MPDLPGGFDWPYSEGLRMDEAMNPLALLCFGCYGNVLPNQNGAPIQGRSSHGNMGSRVRNQS